jgi:hypothetical protein
VHREALSCGSEDRGGMSEIIHARIVPRTRRKGFFFTSEIRRLQDIFLERRLPWMIGDLARRGEGGGATVAPFSPREKGWDEGGLESAPFSLREKGWG